MMRSWPLLLLCLLWLLACSAERPAEIEEPIGEPMALESGLVVTQLREGSGPSPVRSSTVIVHYHGTLADGSVFDSSVERGKPAQFPLTRVIPCWTEGLQQMKLGGKARLLCPPAIAYGALGKPPKIPSNATLYFDVELLDIL
jgi:FKBP-type peptidyl-prolyl cis-trans isomerase FkpA